MKIKTLQKEYKLNEFNFYITEVAPNSMIATVDFLINADESDLEYVEEDFSNIFAVETDNHTHVFSGYEVSEYYVEGDALHIICTK